MKIPIQIKKLSDTAKTPVYAHEGDAGMDIFSDESATIQPNGRVLISTGLSMAVPLGYEAQVRPKSGLAINNGITLLNSPGTIDSGYRGEVKVVVYNASRHSFHVDRGMKIAQLVINKVDHADIQEVDSLDDTTRGEGGFGSTGDGL